MDTHILRMAIILGNTRPGRNGEAVARRVYNTAEKHNSSNNGTSNDRVNAVAIVEFEYINIKDYNLPLLDKPILPSQGRYTKAGSAKIDSFDAYIFVATEYNHGIPGVSKNAIDYLYKEWNNKAAGFVS